MNPKCPYCETEWPQGPEFVDYPNDFRVVFCPSCAKVIAVVQLAVSSYDT